ncbi:MAG TPA: polymer-forming cytoskeletal protein [Steroidobacteraceae bacterium]|nr:polymer-forming cytoskeletal protein [Steroidobacteraceae bacterium]
MFSRDPKQPRIDTLIDKASHVHGDLVFAGGLHLDGKISGNVRADPNEGSSLSVSETGAIEGNVEVSSVMLNGTVKGDIVARERIVLGATAKVQGSVYYGVIEMTLGAQIMGKLTQVSAEAKAGAGAEQTSRAL